VNLAEQAGKQTVAETEPEHLIELEEEMEQSKDTVEGLGQSLKETIGTRRVQGEGTAGRPGLHQDSGRGEAVPGTCKGSTRVPQGGLGVGELQGTHGGRGYGKPLVPAPGGIWGEEQDGGEQHDGARGSRKRPPRVGPAEGK
jgi:hypothetical protein